MDSSFSVSLRLDDVGTPMPFYVMKEESTSSLQRTRRQSLRSFLLAAELDIVRPPKLMMSAEHRLKVGAVVCVVLGAAGVLIVLGGAFAALLEPDPPAWVALAFALVGTVCTAPVLIAGLGLLHSREWARRLITVVLNVALVYFCIALALPPIVLFFKPHLWSDRFPEFLVLYLCVKGLCLFFAWRAARFFTSPIVRQITGAA